MIPAKKDFIFSDAQYGMIEHYLNDVVVKELISQQFHKVTSYTYTL